MASFLQWQRKHAAGQLKRAYLVSGPEKVLVEEVIDKVRQSLNPGPLDYLSASAAKMSDAEVWAAVNQYPLDPKNKRLLLIRDAEKIKDWDPVEPWLTSRYIPQVHVVFVWGYHEARDPETGRNKEVEPSDRLPESVYSRIKSTGLLVRCTPLNQKDAIEYIAARSGTNTSLARKTLERVRGDLYEALNFATKLSFFQGPFDDRVVDALTTPKPERDFLLSLIGHRKRLALEAIPQVPEEKYGRVISALDRSLEVLVKVHRASKQSKRPGEVESKTRGLVAGRLRSDFNDLAPIKEQDLALALVGAAKHYDHAKVLTCLAILARVDAAYQSGARKGLLETLVARW